MHRTIKAHLANIPNQTEYFWLDIWECPSFACFGFFNNLLYPYPEHGRSDTTRPHETSSSHAASRSQQCLWLLAMEPDDFPSELDLHFLRTHEMTCRSFGSLLLIVEGSWPAVLHYTKGLAWSRWNMSSGPGSNFLDPQTWWIKSQNHRFGAPLCSKPLPFNSTGSLVGINIIEGSLEVKLPTIWTDEKQRWEESEKRREEKRKEKNRKEKESAERRSETPCFSNDLRLRRVEK